MTLRRETGGVWILENEAVRVRFAAVRTGMRRPTGHLGDRWRLVLEAGSKKRADLHCKADGRATAVRLTSIEPGGNDRTRVSVRLQGSTGVHRVTETVTMEQGDPFVRVEIYDAVEGLSEVSRSSRPFLRSDGTQGHGRTRPWTRSSDPIRTT